MQPRTREQLSQIVGATQTLYPDATDGADTPSEEPGAGTYPFAFRRTLLFELRPAQLQGEGLLVALRNHAVAIAQRTGLAIQVDLPDTCALPPAHEDALYRVAQEALANVARHAQARHALVRLRRLDEWVELTIEDDGVGIIPLDGVSANPESAAGHYGLRGMRARVEGLGGRLAVQPGSTAGPREAPSSPLASPHMARSRHRPKSGTRPMPGPHTTRMPPQHSADGARIPLRSGTPKYVPPSGYKDARQISPF
jgi:hypothetical protein